MSPGSCTPMRRVIWRTISSMCLSWIDTPWSRYTFWTSSTRYSWVSRTPLISMSSFGSTGPSVRGSPAWTSSPSTHPRRADDGAVGVLGAVVGRRSVTHRPLPSSSPMRTTPDVLASRAAPLGRAGLEQLDHAGQTAGDVLTGHTTGVEGPHRQLRAGLADRLGGDDADGLAELDRVAGGQRAAVAEAADAELGVAGEHRAHPHPVRPAGRRAAPSTSSSPRMVLAGDDRAVGQLGVVQQGPAVQLGLEVVALLGRVRARRSRSRCRGWCRSRPRG